MIRRFRAEYVLDSDWIIQAFRGYGEAAAILRRLTPPRIAVSWITVAEVYEGAFASPNPQATLAQYRQFLSPYEKMTANEEIAELFAEHRALLRRRGQMISDADVFLAATALHYD